MSFIDRLIKRIHYIGMDKRAVFMWSCIIKNEKRILDLIDIIDTVNYVDKTGQSPLTMAIRRNSKQIVEILLDNGADINLKNTKGQTPLVVACKKGNFEIVKMLLDRGANIYLEDVYGKTALMYALYNKKSDILQALLNVYHGEENPDITYINKKDNAGKTALIWSCLLEFEPTKQLDYIFLLTKDLLVKNNNVEMLLNENANVNIVDNEGKTALMYAVDSENNMVIKKLLECNGYSKYSNIAYVGINLKNYDTSKKELAYIKDSNWLKYQTEKKGNLERCIKELEEDANLSDILKNQEMAIKERIRVRYNKARILMHRGNLKSIDTKNKLRNLAVDTSKDKDILKIINILTCDISKEDKIFAIKKDLQETNEILKLVKRFKARIELGIKREVLNVISLCKEKEMTSLPTKINKGMDN